MLKKVNYAMFWFLTSCAFIQYVASFIISCFLSVFKRYEFVDTRMISKIA